MIPFFHLIYSQSHPPWDDPHMRQEEEVASTSHSPSAPIPCCWLGLCTYFSCSFPFSFNPIRIYKCLFLQTTFFFVSQWREMNLQILQFQASRTPKYALPHLLAFHVFLSLHETFAGRVPHSSPHPWDWSVWNTALSHSRYCPLSRHCQEKRLERQAFCACNCIAVFFVYNFIFFVIQVFFNVQGSHVKELDAFYKRSVHYKYLLNYMGTLNVSLCTALSVWPLRSVTILVTCGIESSTLSSARGSNSQSKCPCLGLSPSRLSPEKPLPLWSRLRLDFNTI